MTVYVNMHNADRLTAPEAEALLDALGRGISVAEDLRDEKHPGLYTPGYVNKMVAAETKLFRALRKAKEKAGIE